VVEVHGATDFGEYDGVRQHWATQNRGQVFVGEATREGVDADRALRAAEVES